jgi:hypothetical protein
MMCAGGPFNQSRCYYSITLLDLICLKRDPMKTSFCQAPTFMKTPLAIALCLTSASVLANPQMFQSARSFAMGGTGVAIAQPASAGFANPAMLASKHPEWSDDFGLVLPSIYVRAADEEETVDQVDDIQDVIDTLESDISGFDGTASAAQVGVVQEKAADLRDRLTKFDQDTVRLNGGLGLSLAFPSKTTAVGIHTKADLVATIRGEISNDDISALDAIATASGAADVDSELAAIRNPDDTLNLTSEGQALASAVGEIGISFAREFSLNNGETFQLGVTPKYMQLRTYQYEESVSSFDDDDTEDSNYETDKSGFNLDLGGAYAFGENKSWNVGAVIKNLIPMELDSVDGSRTLEVDPMITAGIAKSGEFYAVSAELDLTERKAFGFEDDTQWLAVGAEFDAFRFAQLRLGARQNLASNDDNDGIAEETQFTAGIGLNILGARLDLGALVSDADMGAALELGAAF